MQSQWALLLAVLTATVTTTAAIGVATASIDLGYEWIKIGLVKPGVPMDIVLNKESKRKSANMVALRDGELLFSGPALTTSVKYPQKTYQGLMSLLGQQFDSPLVAKYQKRFPEHTLEADKERGTPVFRVSEEVSYSVEELVALIIQNCVTLAEETAEQKISGVVITVPPYFGQAERKSLLLAAEIAGVKVMQLVNGNVGVAINYGVFRRTEFNETERNLMFYDMGSQATTATIVGYSTVKEKGKDVPQLHVKSVGYDRTLGGREFDLRMREHLLAEFLKNPKVKGDVSANHRSMAKLLKEAQKVKTVLSANTATRAQIEGLYKEIDFKTEVTRETLNELTSDLVARVRGPIDQALEGAGMTMEHIEELIIIGGGTRVPAVQEQLIKANDGRELGKKLNGDEAQTLGASYQAAVNSKAFRVAKFIVKDAHLFPVQVRFEREVEGDDGEVTVKNVTRTIFHRHNELPQKKVLSFNKASGDFSFDVFFGELDFLSEEMLSMFGSRNISSVTVSGVQEKLEAHAEDKFQKIKAHFKLDDSGIISVARAEVVFEGAPEPEPKEEESTLSKLGNMIFGSDDKDANATKDGDKDGKAEESGDSEGEAKEDAKEKKEGESEGDKAEEAKDDKKAEDEKSESESLNATDPNATSTNATASNSTNATKPEKKKPKTIKEPLILDVDFKYVSSETEERVKSSQGKIFELREAERQRQENAMALNMLETFIYSAREALYKEDYEEVSTEEQREEVRAACTKAADWLDDEGWEANATQFKAQAKLINATFKGIVERADELQRRPKAIGRLMYAFNLTHEFTKQVENFTSHQPENSTRWISEKEMKDLWTLTNDTQKWFFPKWKEQNETALSDTPVLKSSTIEYKAAKLERELVYLMKRPQPRPKKIKKPKIDLNKTVTLNGTTINLNSTNSTKDDSIEINSDDVVDTGAGDGSTDTETKPEDSEEPATDGASAEDGDATPSTDGDEAEKPKADHDKEDL